MDSWTSEHRIQCRSCTAVIDVGIRLPRHNATEHDNTIEKGGPTNCWSITAGYQHPRGLTAHGTPGRHGSGFDTPSCPIDFGQSSGDHVRHGGRHLRRQSDTVTHVRGFDGEHHQPVGCPAERLT